MNNTENDLEFINVAKQLEPDFTKVLEIKNFVFSCGKWGYDIRIEIYRRVKSLYDAICSARFNLSISCKRGFPEYLDPENPKEATLWIRTQFANNAILWYNSIYDLILQVFWFYFKFFEKLRSPLKLSVINMNDILSKCSFSSIKNIQEKNSNIDEALWKKLTQLNENDNRGKIKDWANILKHRSTLAYNGLDVQDTIPYATIDVQGKKLLEALLSGNYSIIYNSRETKTKVDLEDVINTMKSYHSVTKGFIGDMNEVLFKI